MNNEYKVILFYQYCMIDDVIKLKQWQESICNSLGLLGRIIVAKEGINGTISGKTSDIDKYIKLMHQDKRFEKTDFKSDDVDGQVFKKLSVKVKDELVNLSLKNDVNPLLVTGKHLSPKQWLKASRMENTVILDARNDYEYDLGHFKNAIKPEINNFRELPKWIKENKELLKDKKILTYCTGGVRCEKLSGWLINEGFDDVNQLDGGIVTYSKDSLTKGVDFVGKCYVFDQRISVAVNSVNPEIVGKDYFTGLPCERYINCANPFCNKKLIASASSERKFLASCCSKCRSHPNNRYVISNNISIDDVLRINNERND